MKKRILGVLFAVVFVFTLGTPARAAAPIAQELYESNNEYVKAIVHWDNAVHADDAIADETARRADYIRRLKEQAGESQKEAVELLESKGDDRIEFESFYIINALCVTAPVDVLEELSTLDGVTLIEENEKVEIETAGEVSDPNDDLWNLEMTGVLSTWDRFGTKGEGVTIGFIDSGVDFTDPSIRKSFRGTAPDGTVQARGNWCDLISDEPLPVDDFKHGTATLGVAVGDSEERPVGVAPGAKWIAVRAFSSDFAMNEYILKAGQWMLAPDGDPSKAPDIINNSWGGKSSLKPWFVSMLDSWYEAGIFPVFAAGNSSEPAGPGSIDNPASLERAFAVGAVDRNKKLGSYSKRGPSGFNKNVIKPEIVAPGSKVYTTSRDGRFEYWTGTSIAAPHVSGTVALMLSVNGDLAPEEIRNILIASATPLTDSDYPSSPNMGYGYGLINVEKAVEMAYREKDAPAKTDRIAGKDRYETSRKIATRYFDTADHVYLASGLKFTDGLTMGPLAGRSEGPLLLLENGLDEETKELIKALDPSKVTIIGGNSSVPESAERELEKIGLYPQRINGANRFDTAARIAEGVIRADEAFLVNGYIDADAINIAGVAASRKTPVLLTEKDRIPDGTLKFLKSRGTEKVILVGGRSQIGEGAEEQLRSMGIVTERIAGATRYETGLTVNRRYGAGKDGVFIANGINTADALAISPVAAKNGALIQITDRYQPVPGLKEFIETRRIERITILGGKGSVDPSLEKIMEEWLRNQKGTL